MDDEPSIYIGVNLPAKQGVSNHHVVDAALAQGYDLITARITSRSYRKSVQMLYAESLSSPDPPCIPPPIAEDLVVFPGSHVSNTIALCAPWAELDSKDARLAEISFQVLRHEVAYAKFCGLPYVVIEGPRRRTHLARYAHALAKLLRQFPELKFIIHTTFMEEFRENQPPSDILSTWDVWDGVRCMCDHPPNLFVALEVHKTRVPNFVLSRWFCEPVAMLILSESHAFVQNPKLYPVLLRHTQLIVKHFAKLKPFLLIKENLGPHKSVDFAGGDDACLIYLRNLLAATTPAQHSRKTSKNEARISVLSGQSHCSTQSGASRHIDADLDMDIRGIEEMHIDSLPEQALEEYSDVLQSPLQPLHVALDNSVYETFENDPVKYAQYYRAILAALQSLSSPLRLDSAQKLTPPPLFIAVVGAGRGALVDRALAACSTAGLTSRRAVTIYAVEKHAGAAAYLHARKSTDSLWDPVEVVLADMRNWKPSHPCHIVVSELLGSFGDNELSPECLAPIERDPQILAHGGVMIPASYTSYAAPVFCPIVWSKARSRGGDGLQTPYVVRLKQSELIGDPQPLWTFNHPAELANSRSRYAKLSFVASQRTRVYGLVGFFEAILFPGVELSTNPATMNLKSPDLVSWFPMFFPLKQPLDAGGEMGIDASIWREVDTSRVWYEWTVESYDRRRAQRVRNGVATVHNPDGVAQALYT